jgi:MFS transporter, ACS family, glucarate transporter
MVEKRTRNLILGLLFLGWALGNLDRLVINYAILSIQEDLNLSASSTGIILSSFFAGYALLQMPGGWLADRLGARKVLLISVVMLSIFTALTGLAWSLVSMVIIRFLFGVGEGSFMPASTKMISLTFPQEGRAKAMSVLLSSGAIMAIITPIISVTVLQAIGWQSMFVIMGFMGIVIAIAYMFLLKLPNSNPGTTNAQAVAPVQKGTFSLLFKTPMMWNLLIAFFSIYTINWGLTSWMPTYLVTVRGLDLMSIGWLQTIPGIGMIAGMYLCGYLVDRLPKGRVKLIGGFSAAFAAILMYLMFNAPSVASFITYQTLNTFFVSMFIMVLNAILVKYLPSTVTGSAMGFVNTGGQLAGFITPMVIGFIVDAFNGSFDAAFWMLIGFAIICIGAIMTINLDKGELLKQQNE